MTTPPPDDDFTELVDASIGRVDLVDQAANGTSFLIAKQRDGSGLLDPGFVRGLVAKGDAVDAIPPERASGQVTMTGSPAALMQLIHQAAVAKAAKETPMADLDPTTALAEPEGDAPGQPTVPGSPAWEAIDAATARKWTGILARARSAIALLSERELIEAASADPDDGFAAMDLDDACGAIDYAISVLAPFAVSEQAAADCASDMEAVGKALLDFDSESLADIEVLAAVRKAGRTLSARNEATIRSAVEALNGVLASLPPAPDDSGRPVAKTQETTVPEPETPAAPETEPADDITKAASPQDPAPEDVAKAKPQTAVYDRRGRLIGVADPGSITMVADDGEEEPGPVEEAAEAPPETEPVAEAPALDLEPAPADEIGTPSDDVTKKTVPPTDTTPDDVLKSIAKAAAEAAIAGLTGAQGQLIAQLTETVETLKSQVEALEEQPAMPKVFANGAAPGSGAVPPPQPSLRGQDQGAPPMGADQALQMKKGLYGAANAADQNTIATDMQTAAIAALSNLHRGATPQ